MADQLSFASLDFAAKKKRTKRDAFLAEMAAVLPWAKLGALIQHLVFCLANIDEYLLAM